MTLDKRLAGVLSGIAAVFLVFPVTAQAEGQAESDWSLDGYVSLGTDYRDRGLSLTKDDPVLVGNMTLGHTAGWYAGVKAAYLANGFPFNGQAEFFLGRSFESNTGYIYDLSLELDTYWGDKGDNIALFPNGPALDGRYSFPEINASVARDFGLIYTRMGLAYAPDGRWSNMDGNSLYGYMDVDIPIPMMPELTFIGHMGYDVIGNGYKNRFDWGAGISAFVNDTEFTLMYEKATGDTRSLNGYDRGSSGLILSAKLYF